MYNASKFNPTGEFPPEFFEKKAVRRMANRIGFAVLALFAVMIGWSFLYFRITAILGISTADALSLTREPMFSQILQAVISIFMTFLPFLVLIKSMYLKPAKIIPFGKPKNKLSGWFILGGIGFCLFASFATDATRTIFQSFGFNYPATNTEQLTGILGFLIEVLLTACLPALIEEFAMRGVVLGLLRPFGDGFAIICSSLVFGFMHATFLQIPFAFLVGLLLAIVTVKTDSIWPAVVIHALNNFISVFFSYLNMYVGANKSNIIYTSFLCIALIISVISTVALLKRGEDTLKITPSNTAASEKKKIAWFITAPTVLISFLAALAIAYFLR